MTEMPDLTDHDGFSGTLNERPKKLLRSSSSSVIPLPTHSKTQPSLSASTSSLPTPTSNLSASSSFIPLSSSSDAVHDYVQQTNDPSYVYNLLASLSTEAHPSKVAMLRVDSAIVGEAKNEDTSGKVCLLMDYLYSSHS